MSYKDEDSNAMSFIGGVICTLMVYLGYTSYRAPVLGRQDLEQDGKALELNSSKEDGSIIKDTVFVIPSTSETFNNSIRPLINDGSIKVRTISTERKSIVQLNGMKQ